MGEMSSFASDYAAALSEATQLAVIICDRDHCIAAAGAPKRDLLEKSVTPELEKIVENRKLYTSKGESLCAIEGCDRGIVVACPIISAGDITGCVLLIENEGVTTAIDSDIKLCEVAAKFLGSRIE